MSVQSVGHKFVELCRQGKNFDVMRTMYAPNIVSVEGDGKETAGQKLCARKQDGMTKVAPADSEESVAPIRP